MSRMGRTFAWPLLFWCCVLFAWSNIISARDKWLLGTGITCTQKYLFAMKIPFQKPSEACRSMNRWPWWFLDVALYKLCPKIMRTCSSGLIFSDSWSIFVVLYLVLSMFVYKFRPLVDAKPLSRSRVASLEQSKELQSLNPRFHSEGYSGNFSQSITEFALSRLAFSVLIQML